MDNDATLAEHMRLIFANYEGDESARWENLAQEVEAIRAEAFRAGFADGRLYQRTHPDNP